MSRRKLSEIPYFQGKDFLLLCQARGSEILGKVGVADWPSVTVVGLATLLIERGIIDDNLTDADRELIQRIVGR